MSTLTIVAGAPRSGKTEYIAGCRKQADLILSEKLVRKQASGKDRPYSTEEVQQMIGRMAADALNNGRDVWVETDRTSARARSRYIALAHDNGADAGVVMIDTPMKIVNARNGNPGRAVEKAIREAYVRYEEPDREEGLAFIKHICGMCRMQHEIVPASEAGGDYSGLKLGQKNDSGYFPCDDLREHYGGKMLAKKKYAFLASSRPEEHRKNGNDDGMQARETAETVPDTPGTDDGGVPEEPAPAPEQEKGTYTAAGTGNKLTEEARMDTQGANKTEGGTTNMAKMAKETFTFNSTFLEAANELPEGDREKFVYALVAYGIGGEEIELTGAVKGMFRLAKTQIDAADDKGSISMILNGGK